MNLSQKKIFKHSVIATLIISLGGISLASFADTTTPTAAPTATASAPSADDHAARKARWEEFHAKREQERTQRRTEMFQQADTNHDGKVSLAEWLAFKPPRPDRQHDPRGDRQKDGPRDEQSGREHREHSRDLTAWLQKVDANHDGKISPAEAESYAPWIAKHFAEIDTNHDGLISQDELKAFQDAKQAKWEEKFKQHRTEEFKKADTNNDGQLTLAEWLAFKPPLHHHHGFWHHHGFFGGHHGFYDRDHGQGSEEGRHHGDDSSRMNDAQAGAIDVAKHFNEIDTDHNGQISQDELRAYINAQHEKSQS